MDKLKKLMVFAVLFWAVSLCAQTTQPDFDKKAQQILADHYQKYKDLEYFSGASLSVYIPKQPIKNYYIGQVSHDPNSQKISADSLFEIGSITKSFTAAVILQLEKEGKLKLADKIGQWLPEYSKWSNVTIEQLLNMTSGLPNYSDNPMMNAAEASDLAKLWSNVDLINFSYPQGNFAPPLKPGYFYSNTGYILAALIVEKITQDNFENQLKNRTIKLAELKNTFYNDTQMPPAVTARLVHAYNYNQYDNPFLVGKDVRDNNLSWAGAAGAVVANSEDIIHWVKALFVDNKVLDITQKQQLMQVISVETGKPIKQTSEADSKGFALGVAQGYDKSLQGVYWYYEGETLGFRALYFYSPCNGVIISSIFNSATNGENDHAGLLMKQIYQLALQQYPQLKCSE